MSFFDSVAAPMWMVRALCMPIQIPEFLKEWMNIGNEPVVCYLCDMPILIDEPREEVSANGYHLVHAYHVDGSREEFARIMSLPDYDTPVEITL